MKKNVSRLAFGAMFLMILGACEHGQHNQAVVEGVNANDTRIWGPSRDADPKQLANEYPEDETGATADRIFKIRDKMYPN